MAPKRATESQTKLYYTLCVSCVISVLGVGFVLRVLAGCFCRCAHSQDQLMCTTPVSGGMGMQLLQKMGWRPGEGLGKERNGALQPLLLEVKLDKKGLVAAEEVRV